MGTQYRSVIFYHTPEQKSALDLQNVACNLLEVLLCHSRCFLPPSAEVAEEVKDKVQKEHYPGTQLVTQIVPAGQYWSAEVPTIPYRTLALGVYLTRLARLMSQDYHQLYLDKNPSGYCNHRLRW
jgi:peptide-methionine (S)-S-oxide reductase